MSKSKFKVMTILGTRPEIIRLSRVIKLFDEKLDHVLVHTGQNSDYELSQVFFEDLEIRKPDHFLNISRDSIGKIYGDVLVKTEEVIKQEKPEAILILGDTNSSIAGILARRYDIPFFHMEAGNRCFDRRVPEEINRAIIDHIADYNLVYNEHARRNLLREGLHPGKIFLTGTPMFEVIEHYKAKIDKSEILNELKLEKDKYFVASFHRADNVDEIDNLKKIANILNRLSKDYKLPVICSVHPRTKSKLKKNKIVFDKRIVMHKPFGFFDYAALQKNARCTLSDSGTISEESAILQFPAVTIREAMERPEALDSGTISLTGLGEDAVFDSIDIAIQSHTQKKTEQIPSEYKIKNCSWRVLKLVRGLAGLSRSSKE